MPYVKAFIAGFVATLVFHQGLLWVLIHGNPGALVVWDMNPVPPFGVPRVLSLSFWAGLWGVVLWLVIRSSRGRAYWLKALAFGALAPTLVSMFLVAPLKGQAIAFGWNPKFIVGALLVNAAWGLGTALIMRLINRAAA